MKKIRISTKKTIKERRKSQRLKLPISVKFKLLPREKFLQKILSQDISGGGIRLRLDNPLKKGTRLKTMLYFPNDSRPVAATSKVVWCKEVKAGRKMCFDIGVQHVNIVLKHRQRFVFLFCEMMINYFLLGKAK